MGDERLRGLVILYRLSPIKSEYLQKRFRILVYLSILFRNLREVLC